MGVYDRVIIEEGITLPALPLHLDPSSFEWQSKGLQKTMATYKITKDGRLLKEEKTHREKTEEEKNKMARERTDGECQTWEEWQESESGPLNGPLPTWEQTVDKSWWEDVGYHGTFEFHASGTRIENAPDIYWSYEARFTEGDLQDIVFMYSSQV